MAAIAPFAMLAGTAMSATSQVMQGMAQSRSANFEAMQLQNQQRDYEIRAQQERTAAAQDEARRRDELTGKLETIAAIRSGRGVGLSSPGGMAITDTVVRDDERDVATSRLNHLLRADSASRSALVSGMGSDVARERGRTSLLAGFLGAGSTIGSGIYSYAYPRAGRLS